MTTVNGYEVDPGCYIAGHNGQYGPDELAVLCETFGVKVEPVNDPRWWRRVAEAEHPDDSPRPDMKPEDAWENFSWAADKLEELLNDATEGGYWSWEDGEFFLTQTEVDGWLYVPKFDEFADTDIDYEQAWMKLCHDGPAGYWTDYDDLPKGEEFYPFRITVHYEPEG